MASQIFTGWPSWRFNLDAVRNRGIDFYGTKISWLDLLEQAKRLALSLQSHELYVVDANLGPKSIVAMMAVALTPGASFIWANLAMLKSPLNSVAEALALGPKLPDERQRGRPYYGTLTSGSSANPKIPMGYGDTLAMTATLYDQELFSAAPEDSAVIATCLPMEYSATFMMAILPAWFAARELVLFRPDDWTTLAPKVHKRKTVIVTVPNLLSAACAGLKPDSYDNFTFLTTAGYLSKARIALTRRKLTDVSFMTLYGASEVGIMTVDRAPQGEHHAGKSLYGKPVWIRNPDSNGIGIVTTAGPDCREFYLDSGQPIRRQDGSAGCTDFGHIDSNGNLYLDGRIDGGEKLNGIIVYPKEIERHILSLDGVLDVKVNVHNKDHESSDFIEAIVIGHVNTDTVQEHCRYLANHLRPRAYVVRGETEAQYSSRGKL